MLLANQIAEFSTKLYLKKDWVNQLDILHVDGDSRKVIGGVKGAFINVWTS